MLKKAPIAWLNFTGYWGSAKAAANFDWKAVFMPRDTLDRLCLDPGIRTIGELMHWNASCLRTPSALDSLADTMKCRSSIPS
jgi:hypothetical protein